MAHFRIPNPTDPEPEVTVISEDEARRKPPRVDARPSVLRAQAEADRNAELQREVERLRAELESAHARIEELEAQLEMLDGAADVVEIANMVANNPTPESDEPDEDGEKKEGGKAPPPHPAQETKKFKCQFCEQPFGSAQGLKMHIEKKHPEKVQQ